MMNWFRIVGATVLFIGGGYLCLVATVEGQSHALSILMMTVAVLWACCKDCKDRLFRTACLVRTNCGIVLFFGGLYVQSLLGPEPSGWAFLISSAGLSMCVLGDYQIKNPKTPDED
jgi:hypothetical protein